MISDFQNNELEFIRFVLDQYVMEGEKELDQRNYQPYSN